MTNKETAKKLNGLREAIAEEGIRIRRYSMDPFLKEPDEPGQPDPGRLLRESLQTSWDEWMALRKRLREAAGGPTDEVLGLLEDDCETLSRKIDVVQRELISEESQHAGWRTVRWMLAVLFGLVAVYLWTHGVRPGPAQFEPWPEWGPLKYGEVAFWSAFGALCALLFKATHYMARRDFDRWYQAWYASTFVRAPFLAVVLMMVILEFSEWYGEDTWIGAYLMEEGVKFYFIVFVSFCLGLSTDTTSGILRDLADGVMEFVSRAIGRVAGRLGTAVSREP